MPSVIGTGTFKLEGNTKLTCHQVALGPSLPKDAVDITKSQGAFLENPGGEDLSASSLIRSHLSDRTTMSAAAICPQRLGKRLRRVSIPELYEFMVPGVAAPRVTIATAKRFQDSFQAA